MCKKYTHLTLDERCIIAGLKSTKTSIRNIAKQLNVNASTVSRELRRNSRNSVYTASKAEKRHKTRRKNSIKPRVLTAQVRAKVLYGLSQFHSPEQISGSLKKQDIHISHETIYNFIWNNKREGGELYRYLRHGSKKYNKRSGVNAGRGSIPRRVDISDRPSIVETKSSIGDWDADTVIGANHSGVIVSLVDRCSKITLLRKVPNKTKDAVTAAIIEALTPYKDKVLTITYDNGGEFADHQIIADTLDAKYYFATPYHSWERGLNEHTNGLLRQFVPKKTEFTNVEKEDVAKYQDLLNNRPRKILDFNTPIMVFLYPPTVALQT